jgi:transcriptional regulator with GAF, ATPase, and Fis domain
MEAFSNHKVITKNSEILNILKSIEKIADSDCSVLLTGETGVGKEVFAEYIHSTSNRKSKPLIKVGLSTLSQQLIESELFGHEKGAFTGSVDEKKGLFELSDNGTIFLDDIDDFPYELQAKLLRVLENKEIKRIGGRRTIPLNIRLITSTKNDLQKLVFEQKFRSDLFFRINVFPIVLPNLRDRPDDIPILVEYFLNFFEPDKKTEVSDSAMEALINYKWPGNVRELKNVIQRIALFTNGKIKLENLPKEITGSSAVENIFKRCSQCFTDKKMNFEQAMSCVESNLLEHALKIAEGNRTVAARMLGLSLSTFRDKLRKYNLDNHASH